MKLKFNYILPIMLIPVLAGFAGITSAGNQAGMETPTQMDAQVKKSPTFIDADANKDNYVTPEELKDYPILTQDFEKADAGKDGKLDQHEYLNLLMEKRQERFLQSP